MSEEVNVINESTEVSGLGEKYLTFYIEDALYGIAIEKIIEIIGVEKPTVVPGIPHYIKGIINLRGKVVPVIDTRLKIGAMEAEYTDRTSIIVIDWNDAMVGLIVDRVAEVDDITEENLSTLPDFSNINANKYLSSVCRIGGNLVLLFDVDKLISDESDIGGMF